MKKIILCLLAAVLCGCEPEDLDVKGTAYVHGGKTPWGTKVKDPEPNNPYPLYVFPALNAGEPDFALHLTNSWNFNSDTEFRAAAGHSKRLIVGAVYSTHCDSCERQAPYFEKLARRFASTPVEFAILFVENNPKEIRDLAWVKQIKNVPVYYNSSDFCSDGLCLSSPSVITVWIKDSKVRLGSAIGFPGPNDDKTPDEVYAAYEKKTTEMVEEYLQSLSPEEREGMILSVGI